MSRKKDLLLRIKGIKSTQKITKAMKMVAAAKLKKSKIKILNAVPYHENMANLIKNLTHHHQMSNPQINRLFDSSEHYQKYLLIIATSNRGLCGAFNSSIIRLAKKKITDLLNAGKIVKIICIGKKSYEQLLPIYQKNIINKIDLTNKTGVTFAEASKIIEYIMQLNEQNQFDTCAIIYNHFQSALVQIPTEKMLIPLEQKKSIEPFIDYQCEPNKEELLLNLLPHFLTLEIFHCLLENESSEHGSRMTAMENASKNASEIIESLNLQYNNSRQNAITKELIEIIAGT